MHGKQEWQAEEDQYNQLGGKGGSKTFLAHTWTEFIHNHGTESKEKKNTVKCLRFKSNWKYHHTVFPSLITYPVNSNVLGHRRTHVFPSLDTGEGLVLCIKYEVKTYIHLAVCLAQIFYVIEILCLKERDPMSQRKRSCQLGTLAWTHSIHCCPLQYMTRTAFLTSIFQHQLISMVKSIEN